MQVASLHQTMIALRARRRAVRIARSILYPPIQPSHGVVETDEAPEPSLPRLYPVIDATKLLRRAVLALLGCLLLGACVLGFYLASETLH